MDSSSENQGSDVAKEAMEAVGMQSVGSEQSEAPAAEEGGSQDDLPQGVKERLGRQEKRHQRDMRAMRSQMEQMQAMQSQQPQMQPQQSQQQGQYGQMPQQQGQLPPDQIQQAVMQALQHKDMVERQMAQQRQQEQDAQSWQKKHRELDQHLDSMQDKHDDFQDVVQDPSAPFTTAMRGAALLLPKTGAGSAGEVLYKLGKNREDLERISKLHPADQSAELVKLSHALIAGDSGKPSAASVNANMMGNIKNRPANRSGEIDENTSISDLMNKARAGWR